MYHGKDGLPTQQEIAVMGNPELCEILHIIEEAYLFKGEIPQHPVDSAYWKLFISTTTRISENIRGEIDLLSKDEKSMIEHTVRTVNKYYQSLTPEWKGRTNDYDFLQYLARLYGFSLTEQEELEAA
jgi:hypothetical protein